MTGVTNNPSITGAIFLKPPGDDTPIDLVKLGTNAGQKAALAAQNAGKGHTEIIQDAQEAAQKAVKEAGGSAVEQANVANMTILFVGGQLALDVLVSSEVIVQEQPPAGPPDDPKPVPPGKVDVPGAQSEFHVNKWLTSTYVTAMFTNMLAMVDVLKGQKIQESKFGIKMQEMTWSMSKDLGDRIIAKAQIESQEHMVAAIMGCVSLGVATLGLGMSLGSAAARYKAAKMKAQAGGEEGEGPIRNDIKTGSGPETGKSSGAQGADGPDITEAASPAAAKTKAAQADAAAQQAQQKSQYQRYDDAARAKADANVKADADVHSAEYGTVGGVDAKTGRAVGQAKSQYQSLPVQADGVTPTSAKGVTVNADGTAVAEKPATTKVAEGKPGIDPEVRKTKLVEAAKMEAKADVLHATGRYAMESLSRHLESMVNDFYKMNTTLKKGELDRQMELLRTAKELAKTAADKAAQGVSDPTQLIDAVTKFLEAFANANTQAHMLGRN